jgi:UTP--glucose-1-phosphate uridylyltransferase
VRDLVEKPAPGTAPSRLAIAARYLLPPSIFEYIDRTPPATNGEIQITDTFRLMLKEGVKILGVKLAGDERRCDVGNFDSYCKTFVEFALADPEIGPGLTEFIKNQLGS